MVIAAIVMVMAFGIYIDMKKQYIKLSDKHKININQFLIKQIFYNAISHVGFTTKYGDIYQQIVNNSGDIVLEISLGGNGIITIVKAPIKELEWSAKGIKSFS